MTSAEFIKRLTAITRMRGTDAGPYISGNFEIYEHLADATHPAYGVYVWPSWQSVPTRIDSSSFSAVLARVEALPIDMSAIQHSSNAGDTPEHEEIVWCAIVGVEWAPVLPNVTIVSASDRPINSELFYVLSLSHTQHSEKILRWLGPKSWGYVLCLEEAGTYTREQLDSDRPHFDNGIHRLAIPCHVVESMAVPAAKVKSKALDPGRPSTNRVVRYDRLAAIRKAHAMLKDAHREPA